MVGGSKSVWRGSKVLVLDTLKPATVVVEDGKVVEVLDGVVEVEGVEQVVDVGDDILMPGLVDSHVHINEPGRTDWEGFSTATRAAAAGGVTTVVDMPLNSLPPTTTAENLKVKVDAAKGQCWVDVAFWGGVIPGNSSSLKEMVGLGVPGFKCFLIHSGVDEFPAVNEEQAKEALEQLQHTGATLLFHAECEVDGTNDSGDPAEYKTFLESRPPSMEISAIQLVISLCRSSKVPCHIVHLSAAEALPIIIAARAEG
jgi:allantoinase